VDSFMQQDNGLLLSPPPGLRRIEKVMAQKSGLSTIDVVERSRPDCTFVLFESRWSHP
jgi:hypothetical protein